MTAQAENSAHTLLQLSYQASGGDNWKSVAQLDQSGTIVVGGVSGTFHQITDIRNGRDVMQFDVGPLHGKEATLTDSTWEVDQSGLATFHDGPEAHTNAVNQAFINSKGWNHVPENELHFAGQREENGSTYNLITVTPRGGRLITLWLDAKDHLLKRIAQEDANHQQSTTFFSDYKLIDAVACPFTIRESNGNVSQDVVKSVKAVHFSSRTNDTAFAPPISNFTDADLRGSQDSATVPFTIADGRIVIEVSIAGHPPLPFLLDTGGQNYLTPEAAKLVGVEGSGNIALSGGGAEQENVGYAKIGEMRIGPLELRNQLFIIGKLPPFVQDRGKEPPIAGLVGYELLRRYPATFNYQKKTLTFFRPGAMVKAPPGAQLMKLYFEGHNPFIVASLDGVPGYFGIDTGDRSVITLFRPFYDAHRFPIVQPPLEKRQGGIGGQEQALLTRVGSVSFGPWSLDHPLVNLNFAAQGAFSSEYDAGNIGYETLRNLIFTLDYEHRRVLLEKSTEFGKSTPYNRSGMTLHRNAAGRIEVETMNANTPAAVAGLKVGDVILSMNGEKSEGKALYEFESVLSAPADFQIEVEYQRNGEATRAQFKLRELLPPGAAMLPLAAK